MDRLWLFPPLVRGRKEWGLVVVSCLSGVKDQRTVITARYAAELTGTGVEFQPDLASEGVAPPERLPVVMDGVVRRSDLPLGTAREVIGTRVPGRAGIPEIPGRGRSPPEMALLRRAGR